MTEMPKLNGKSWLAKGLIQIIMILCLIAYSAILTVREFSGVPRSNVGERSYSNSERIIKLETCMEALRQVPTDMASVKTAIESMKSSIDKIEKKLELRK